MNIDTRDDEESSYPPPPTSNPSGALPAQPLAEYPVYETPSTPQLVKVYEIAACKEHTIDTQLQKRYQSKVGALIYAPAAMRATRRSLRDRHSRSSADVPNKSDGCARRSRPGIHGVERWRRY
eukprot:6182549-Pleurochrysis_carterae.AAC.2